MNRSHHLNDLLLGFNHGLLQRNLARFAKHLCRILQTIEQQFQTGKFRLAMLTTLSVA